MAYIDSADLVAYLGRALTDAEEAQASGVIDAACSWVEAYTGRSFTPGVVTDERHDIIDGMIYLGRALGTLTTIKTRTQVIPVTPITLGTSQYSVWDASAGMIAVSGYWGHVEALVTYTPSVTVPADVTLATAMLAASWLGGASSAQYQAQGIKSYSVGGELSVTFGGAGSATVDAPPAVLALLSSHVRMVFA